MLFYGVAAQAQLLPVPGASNPAWALTQAKRQPIPPGVYSQMRTDRMPNANLKGVTSAGNQHYHWDSNRQLTYEWDSQPGSGTIAPDKAVTVTELQTNTTYTYRRRTHSLAKPQALPGPSPSK